MAKNISGVILTDKQALKPSARNAIVASVLPMVSEGLSEFEKVGDKNAFTLEFKDSNGNSAFATLTLTVSTLNPADRKERKVPKKAEKPTETFSVEG